MGYEKCLSLILGDLVCLRTTKSGYLCAVVDWISRRVLFWKLSITLDTTFRIEAIEDAL